MGAPVRHTELSLCRGVRRGGPIGRGIRRGLRRRGSRHL